MMGIHDKINKGLCPNGCGELTRFEKPISILHVIPIDVLIELYEGIDTPEDSFGYLVAHCDKCGFNLSTPPRDEIIDHLSNVTVLRSEPIPIFSQNKHKQRT